MTSDPMQGRQIARIIQGFKTLSIPTLDAHPGFPCRGAELGGHETRRDDDGVDGGFLPRVCGDEAVGSDGGDSLSVRVD